MTSTKDRILELRAKQRYAGGEDDKTPAPDRTDPIDFFWQDCEDIGEDAARAPASLRAFVNVCARACVPACAWAGVRTPELLFHYLLRMRAYKRVYARVNTSRVCFSSVCARACVRLHVRPHSAGARSRVGIFSRDEATL